jgi:putative nucleotidyltransferase with HDIG domain
MRHEYTFHHSVAVCGLMVGLGRALRFDDAALLDIGLAGLLHDIGKAKIPRELLDKPGPLTAAEFETLQKHTLRGHEALAAAGASEAALDVVLNHHERLDGSGYPNRKLGSSLSRAARMAMICDVYDAITSARSYKGALSPGEALEWMRNAPQAFDASMLKAFAKTLGPYPPGSLVRLTDNRLAVVLDADHGDPLDPPLVIVMDGSTMRRLPFVRRQNGGSLILALEYAERLAIADWPAIREEASRTVVS